MRFQLRGCPASLLPNVLNSLPVQANRNNVVVVVVVVVVIVVMLYSKKLLFPSKLRISCRASWQRLTVSLSSVLIYTYLSLLADGYSNTNRSSLSMYIYIIYI